MQQKISHPINDETLPSFVHPTLADVSKELQVAADCWELLRDGKEEYLPKEVKEPPRAYKARLMRASYASFYRDAIVSYAGALSRFELRDPPELLKKYQSNIDADGNSLKAYGMICDARVLRDGGVLMTVDMPPDKAGNRTIERSTGRRPFLAQIERRNVVNWHPVKVAGREIAAAVSILEWAEVRKGRYGVEFEPRYRLMAGGEWKVVKLVATEHGYQEVVATDDDGKPLEGEFTDADGKRMEFPPVVWYSSNRGGFGRGQLPLLSLANLSLDWFREYSDLKELLHKTAMPVPVRKGMLRSGPKGTTPPMILGPNSGLDLPADGSFDFVEVSGSSLAQHVEHLKHIETLIDRQTLSFLFSGGDAEKTATQSILESAQLQASLASMAEGKSSAMESLFQVWGRFSGESVKDGSGIDLDSGVFDQPVTPEKLRMAKDLYNDNLLTRGSVVALEAKAHFLPPDKTVEDEIKELEDQEEEDLSVNGGPDVPGANDLADGLQGLPGQAPPVPGKAKAFGGAR